MGKIWGINDFLKQITKTINKLLRQDKETCITYVKKSDHVNKNESRDMFQKVKMLSRRVSNYILISPYKDEAGNTLT